MLVLYRANALTRLRGQLKRESCGVEHLEPYFDLAVQITSEVGGSDLPEILEFYPPQGRPWTRRFYRVQLEVLGRAGDVRSAPEAAWRKDCEKAADPGSRVGRLETDVNVWCGYAYELLGDSDAATLHWRLARHSPNHPEAAAFALHRLDARYRTEPGATPDPDVAAGGPR
jgi:hypothetical protein